MDLLGLTLFLFIYIFYNLLSMTSSYEINRIIQPTLNSLKRELLPLAKSKMAVNISFWITTQNITKMPSKISEVF